jgi:hypothetical protein
MKKMIFLTTAALTLVGWAAAAQPYGYGYGDRYDRYAYRDSDRDGIPDAREWNRDRDHDGRPDQYDRYDNRRHHHPRARVYRPSYGYGYGERSRYYDRRYEEPAVYVYRGW